MRAAAGEFRVRFAPSPTGDLHIGNARTALFNWLFARHYGGKFILRLEDTDLARSSGLYEADILNDLAWLGIDWDEGPEKNGSYGPYRQSERLNVYTRYLEDLGKGDLIYPCFCTEEELESERALYLKRRQPPRYSGKCRRLTPQQRKNLLEQGKKPAWRFRVGENQRIEFNDLIRGPMKFESDVLGDFIIVRSSGMPAYNFAVVVDDHLMEITHVIRGEDHLSNTAMQLLLYAALGFTPPLFAHHSLILGKDRTKLSKRYGAVSVREFREQGILPEALMNYLALLAGSFSTGQEIYDPDELVHAFSLERAGKSGAIFDKDKLHWMNSIYMHREPPERLTNRLLTFLGETNSGFDGIDRRRLEQIVETIRDNLSTLCDAKDYLEIFLKDSVVISDDAAVLLRDPSVHSLLNTFYDRILKSTATDDHLYHSVIRDVEEISGRHGKNLFMPVRVALTGRTRGPELARIFTLLGKDALLKRLEESLFL
ncbi:MAG: glutamate--tRNA ligase [Syntrophales bacterium]